MVGMSADYIQSLPGKLRIGILAVRSSPANASRLETGLAEIAGVDRVTANPDTGDVVVVYDAKALSERQILVALKTLGCFEARA